MALRLVLAWSCVVFLVPTLAGQEKERRRPNVILIMTDDQGWGDLGYHGNPAIRTPHLDKFAKESVRFKNFHVCPVCSPTRSSLLTGRYNYRTGVVDTYLGRSMMHGDEITLAEILRGVGYVTGIFGKWHLGDCFPMRPQDQGFEEVLVHRGGGIGQPSDPLDGSSYFDPVLQHDGKEVKTKGYCSDVYTDALLNFLEKNREKPFFAYLAFNAPHTPLQVPEKYLAPYRKMDLSPGRFPKVGFPLQGKASEDDTARVYGMVTNIDDNVGRLLAKLEELKLAENTIVIFLTDNGPQQVRFNGGLRGRKGTVFEGGTRVPFFVRWPAGFPGARDVPQIAAHIDVVPTVAAACGAKLPADHTIDGRNLLPLLDKEAKEDWPERNLFFQWHRGDIPQLYRACAVRSPKYRLVQPQGVPEKKGKLVLAPVVPKFLLFDIEEDPYETTDLAEKKPEVVAELKRAYERWFRDVVGKRTVVQPRIHVGAKEEPRTVLTKQDWRGPKAGWGPKDLGHWDVQVVDAGPYRMTVHVPENVKFGVVHFRMGDVELGRRLDGGTAAFENLKLRPGLGRIETWVAQGESKLPVRMVVLER